MDRMRNAGRGCVGCFSCWIPLISATRTLPAPSAPPLPSRFSDVSNDQIASAQQRAPSDPTERHALGRESNQNENMYRSAFQHEILRLSDTLLKFAETVQRI